MLKSLDLNSALIIAIIIAGVLVYFRKDKGEVQATAISALGVRIEALESERSDLRAGIHEKDLVIAKLETKVDEQTKQIGLLTQMVQGVPAWEKLVEGIAGLKSDTKEILNKFNERAA